MKKTKSKHMTLDQFSKINKLSRLLAMALNDLKRAEKSRLYEVDMSSWVDWEANSKCCVCLAGAVIAGCCNWRRKKAVDVCWNALFNSRYANNMHALNCLRRGYVGQAAIHLLGYIQGNKLVNIDRHITPYEVDKTQWWKEMRQLLRDLRAANL